MSVNYKHPIDVPITDLDDSEDDIIFNEHQRPQQSNFINQLDFDHPQTNKTIFNKFKSIFKNDTTRNDYEMVNRSELETPSELSNEENEEPVVNLQNHRIQLLEQKIKNRTIFGVSILLVISVITFVLFFKTNISIRIESTTKEVYSNSTHNFHKTTLLISLDGFHPHYISSQDTPFLHNMMINDYGSPYMTPSFPSSTFPNHWTLITGLYPSEHGIVGNTFWDPKLKKQFINTNPKVGGLDPEFWRGGEPIWKTAESQGLNVAVHQWPGSEVPKIGPKIFDKFNSSELLSSKVERVMEWLDVDDINNRPELILTYVPTIDQFGHKFGISGENLTQALTYVDNFVDLMFKQIEARNLQDIVNVVIVSDHGMAPTSNDRLMYLDDLIDLNKIDHIDGWPLFGLRPKSEYKIEDIYDEIRHNFDLNFDDNWKKNYGIYKVEDIPREFNFGGELNDHKFNYRLEPIWIIPNVGYAVTTKQQMIDKGGDYTPKGVHGYNNTHLLMRAIFLAKGPYFSDNLANFKKIEAFDNIHLYNMLCDTLNLKPAKNNGKKPNDILLNFLPSDWSDELMFPDLSFDVEHIVKHNATYDLLWRKEKDKPKINPESTNTEPLKSMKSEQSTITSLQLETMPKPTDFVTTTTHKTHENLNQIVDHIIDGVEDGLEAIGDAMEDFIDKIFDNDDE